MNKRDATPEEVEKTLVSNARTWNIQNPDYELSLEHWRAKLDEAVAEGYRNEVCDCGAVIMDILNGGSRYSGVM